MTVQLLVGRSTLLNAFYLQGNYATSHVVDASNTFLRAGFIDQELAVARSAGVLASNTVI